MEEKQKEKEKITIEFMPIELDYLIAKLYCDEETIQEIFNPFKYDDLDMLFDRVSKKLTIEKHEQCKNASGEDLIYTEDNVLGFLDEYLVYHKLNRSTILFFRHFTDFALKEVKSGKFDVAPMEQQEVIFNLEDPTGTMQLFTWDSVDGLKPYVSPNASFLPVE